MKKHINLPENHLKIIQFPLKPSTPSRLNSKKLKTSNPSFQLLPKYAQTLKVTETFNPTNEVTTMQIILENPTSHTCALPTGPIGYLEYPEELIATDNTPYHVYNLNQVTQSMLCLLYTSPSPRDLSTSRMPSSA